MSFDIDAWNATDNAIRDATDMAIRDATRDAINARYIISNSIEGILNEATDELEY